MIGLAEVPIVAMISAMWLVVLWPAVRIVRRLGFAPSLAAIVVVPVANVLLLWYVAYAPWPRPSTGVIHRR